MGGVRKRKNQSVSDKGKSLAQDDKDVAKQLSEGSSVWFTRANIITGIIAMITCAYAHSWLVYTLHENLMWFTNIKEVEREISFRTESGLYYSYYKQLVHAPSLSQGIHELMNDRLTEWPDSMNVLERMNIYQEVILAALYRILPIKEEPIMFYIKVVFALHGMLVAALFATTWMLSHSWLAGVLTAVFYSLNRADTTRVMTTIPLRESFSLPFVWLQIAALTYYFKPHSSGLAKRASVVVMCTSTFLFCLFWQFNQFIMLLQALSLFGVWILDMLPTAKIRTVLLAQATSLLAVCVLQFINKMILGSLAMSFIFASLAVTIIRGSGQSASHWCVKAAKVVAYSVLALLLMVAFNMIIKAVIQVEADQHIFEFLKNKFGVGNARDFDSRLYLCLQIFGFLTLDVFERLTFGGVLPFYVCCHLVLLSVLSIACFQNWRQAPPPNKKFEEIGAGDGVQDVPVNDKKKTQSRKKVTNNLGVTHILTERSELAFHTIQCVFFGALAMFTFRMVYFWTPYMCILAALAVGDSSVWRAILRLFKQNSQSVVDVCRHIAMFVLIAVLISMNWQKLRKDLFEDLREFWDPDTVELMEWIINKTPPMASYTGSMQLLAGVKLCTGHPITNHPHYEDKALRHKTKQLYQIYGRRTPEDVHSILTRLGSHYIILEDSICHAPTGTNCRTPDLIDLDNGVVPDNAEQEPGLTYSTVPRFCDEVRYQKPQYAKYFKAVFVNRTFRVYKVL